MVDEAATLIIRDVRPWGGERADVVVAGSRIADVTAPGAVPTAGATEVQGRGQVALPGLVNTHAHVDKSWWGHPWESYGGEGGTRGRIAHERSRRDALGIPGEAVATRVLRESPRTGTTRVRTHVDVDLGVGLRGIEAVRAAAAALEDAIELSIVAFPQDGVLRRPGVLDLLRQAAESASSTSVGSTRRSSTAIPSGSSTACSPSPPTPGAASTSTCTNPPSSGRSRSTWSSTAWSGSGSRPGRSTSRTASRSLTSTPSGAATCSHGWRHSA